MFDNEINELCRDIAEATLDDFTEDEYENMMDEMFAEHQAMMYAAQSYDNDAIAYGLGQMALKLCKDCKNFLEGPEADPVCTHPHASKCDDLVYGNHNKRTCSEMRQNKTLCGTFGKLYAAKPGFIPMVIE